MKLSSNTVSIFFTGSYNIALKKTTMQGPKDYCDPKCVCHPSYLAVDGDLGQNVFSGDCAHTTNDGYTTGSWWSVDFQGDFYLSSIRILRRAKSKQHFVHIPFL